MARISGLWHRLGIFSFSAVFFTLVFPKIPLLKRVVKVELENTNVDWLILHVAQEMGQSASIFSSSTITAFFPLDIYFFYLNIFFLGRANIMMQNASSTTLRL